YEANALDPEKSTSRSGSGPPGSLSEQSNILFPGQEDGRFLHDDVGDNIEKNSNYVDISQDADFFSPQSEEDVEQAADFHERSSSENPRKMGRGEGRTPAVARPSSPVSAEAAPAEEIPNGQEATSSSSFAAAGTTDGAGDDNIKAVNSPSSPGKVQVEIDAEANQYVSKQEVRQMVRDLMLLEQHAAGRSSTDARLQRLEEENRRLQQEVERLSSKADSFQEETWRSFQRLRFVGAQVYHMLFFSLWILIGTARSNQDITFALIVLGFLCCVVGTAAPWYLAIFAGADRRRRYFSKKRSTTEDELARTTSGRAIAAENASSRASRLPSSGETVTTRRAMQSTRILASSNPGEDLLPAVAEEVLASGGEMVKAAAAGPETTEFSRHNIKNDTSEGAGDPDVPHVGVGRVAQEAAGGAADGRAADVHVAPSEEEEPDEDTKKNYQEKMSKVEEDEEDDADPVPYDFILQGTLSCVCQDGESAEGRFFTVCVVLYMMS
ncbi:unnamed protein product, partial [Amoebophrya sp. A120]